MDMGAYDKDMGALESIGGLDILLGFLRWKGYNKLKVSTLS